MIPNIGRDIILGFIIPGLYAIFYGWDSERTVSWNYYMISIFTIILVLIIFVDHSYSNYKSMKMREEELKLRNRYPKIRTCLPKEFDDYSREAYLLDPSNLYVQDTMVSFIYTDGHYEQLVGAGSVINIQDNQFIQVEMSYIRNGCEQIVNRLKHNDAETLKNTYVRPTISKTIIKSLQISE